MAASIAYYAIASIVPLLVVALAVLSVLGATGLLVDALRSSLSAGGEEVLNRVLTDTRGHGTVGAVGFLFALWSGGKVFRGLSIGFTEVYDTASEESLPVDVGKGLLVLGLLLGNLLALLALVVAFLPLYYVLPPVSVSVRHALPGTVFAAFGWVLLQVGFFYYAGSAGRYAAYGLLGAVLNVVLDR